MNEKILYLSYDGMTDILGQSQILSYIIKLSGFGYRFTLISFEKKNKFEQFETVIRQICDANNIIWIPLKYSKYPPIFSTVWDVFKLQRRLKKLVKTGNFQLIHCRSYLTCLTALKMKKEYGIPFIFDMRGFYADERVEGDLWNLKNPLFGAVYKYLKKKELEFIENSAAIVSLTKVGAEIMKTWWNPDEIEKKLSIIPCAADFEVFKRQTQKSKFASREMLEIPQDAFVITYLGTMGTWYLFEEILSFFAWIKTHEPNAKFLMISPNKKKDVLAKAEKHQINVSDVLVKFATRKDVSMYLDSSDIGIFFIKPSFSKKSSSPTKMGEMLAKGIPIVTNSGVGDVDEIIQNLECGVTFDTMDFASFENKKTEIFDLIKMDGKRVRKNARKYFDLDSATQKYLKIYRKILQ